MSVEPITLTTSDGEQLEGELATADGVSRATVVLCHPHPQYGGTMRSIVIGALFDALPAMDFSCLRFNFRGVERSTGVHEDGRGELHDVQAAVDLADSRRGASEPLVLAGWSFGADMTLATADRRLSGWLGIAPPLRFARDFEPVAHDPRPKQLVLGQHDEFREPASVVEATRGWTGTGIDVIPGASHFFVGRTDRVVTAAQAFLERLAGPPPSNRPS
jgi:alpha/beta superfamily hydrolase